MKKKTTIKVVLLCLILVTLAISMLALNSCASKTVFKNDENGFFYRLDNKGAHVIGYTGNDEVVNIRDEFDRRKVVSIDDYVFFNNKSIKVIKLNKNIVEIGNETFSGCSNLESVIGETSENSKIQKIGQNAFQNCSKLNKFDFSEVTHISACAFQNCLELVDVKLPKAVNVSNSAFEGCKKIESIELSMKLKVLGKNAFDRCEGLKTLIIPANATKDIYLNNTFKGTNLENVTIISDDVQGVVGKSAFKDNKTLKKVILRGNIVKIDNEAFSGTLFKSISIPDSMVELGDGCFSNSNLTEMNLSRAKITKIGVDVFSNCTVLKTVLVSDLLSEVGKGAFKNCKILEKFSCSCVNLKEIGDEAFYGCQELKDVNFKDSNLLTTIGKSAFQDCKNLTAIQLPDTLITLGESAFSGCTEVTEIILSSHKSFNSIPKDVFNGVESLESLIIPENITTIEEGVFKDCINLTDLTIPGEITYGKLSSVFHNNIENQLTKLKLVGAGIDIEFSNCGENLKQLENLELGPELTIIKRDQFLNCKTLQNIIIASNIFKDYSFSDIFYNDSSATLKFKGETDKIIKDKCFEGCSKLKFDETEFFQYIKTLQKNSFAGLGTFETINLPNVESIGEEAFSGCAKLQNVTLGDKVTTIGTKAFQNCEQLKTINLGALKTLTTTNIFKDCNALTTVVSKSLTNVGDSVFLNAQNLKTIDLTAATTIGAYAFKDCTALFENGLLNLPKIESIGQEAFSGCKGLTKLSLGSSCETVGENAFGGSGCNFDEITINKDIFTGGRTFASIVNSGTTIVHVIIKNFAIPNNVFQSSDVQQITLGTGVKEINSGAFANCRNLEKVLGASELENIGGNAFKGCSQLTTIDLSNVTTIGENAFKGCSQLATIDLSKTTTIYEGAFNNCAGLKTLVLGKELTSVSGGVVFSGCEFTTVTVESDILLNKQLNEIIGNGYIDNFILENISKIGDAAFAGCSFNNLIIKSAELFNNNRKFGPLINSVDHVSNIKIDGPTEIKTGTFENCTKLTKIDLSGVTKIGLNAFKGCTGLKTINLKGVRNIGDGAFKDCTSLNKVTSFEISTISNDVFSGCTSLQTFNLSNVTTIGDRAFSDCTLLNNLDLSKVTTIGESAFSDCSGLKFIGKNSENILQGTIKSNAFAKCENLKTIKFGLSLGEISPDAFGTHIYSKVTIPLETLNSKSFIEIMPNTSIKEVEVEGEGAILCEGAFENCTNVQKIALSQSINTIGDKAFSGCINLTDFNLRGINSIGSSAFDGCTKLSKITLLNEIKSIKTKTFSNCNNLEEINLSGIQIIGESAFSGCTKLNNLNLSNVTTIGNNAFSGCITIQEVILGNNITSIGESVFSGCESLTTIDLSRVAEIGDSAFSGCTSLKDITLGSSYGLLTTVGANAFGDHQLDKVTIYLDVLGKIKPFNKIVSNNVATVKIEGTGEIPDSAFSGCSTIQEVILGNNITSIGESVFSGCESLTTIDLSRVTEIGNSAFSGCTSFGNSLYNNRAYLPQVEKLGASAFSNCESLSSVYIPKISIINNNTFENCNKLSEIDLSNVTTIGNSAFSGCIALKNINLANVTTLKNDAFNGCSNLQKIEVINAETIGDNTFTGCINLKNLKFTEALNSVGKTPFDNAVVFDVVAIPLSVLQKISFNAIIESKVMKLIVDASSSLSKKIPDNLLKGYSNIIEIKLSDNITEIGMGAFDGCIALTTINLSQIEIIGAEAFNGCKVLNNISLKNIKQIGDSAFNNCTGLTIIDLSNIASTPSINTIGKCVFKGCTSLKIVTLGNSIFIISNEMFSGCTSLTTIDLSRVTEIGDSAFSGCTSLKKLTFGESLAKVGVKAFDKCAFFDEISINSDIFQDIKFKNMIGDETKIDKITLNGFTKVADQAFSECKKVQKIELGVDITEIGVSAFSGCTSLTKINAQKVKTVGKEAFSGCIGLTHVIMQNIAKISIDTFSGCSQITHIRIPFKIFEESAFSGELFTLENIVYLDISSRVGYATKDNLTISLPGSDKMSNLNTLVLPSAGIVKTTSWGKISYKTEGTITVEDNYFDDYKKLQNIYVDYISGRGNNPYAKLNKTAIIRDDGTNQAGRWQYNEDGLAEIISNI